MGLIKVGRVIRPHGVKGAMKVSSTFRYKKDVFKKDNTVIINNKTYKILNYIFAGGGQLDICSLEGINTIDDVISIRQNDIYVNKNELNTNELLLEELVDMEVYYKQELLGKVTNIQDGLNPLIIVNDNLYIPRQDVFIDKIEDNKIYLTDKYKELI